MASHTVNVSEIPDIETEKRPIFGNRELTKGENVFQHNAWDNVEWTEEQEKEAREKVALNSAQPPSSNKIEELEMSANVFWDKFYGQHENKFFKDRNWLMTEFPELNLDSTSVVPPSVEGGADDTDEPTKRRTILEVGCGVGNSVFPILQSSRDTFVYCCDFSSKAVDLVRTHDSYEEKRCNAFVWDITTDIDPSIFPISEASLDIVLLVFVLSALNPQKFEQAIGNLTKLLKPGGVLLFRDYGRYDLSQLRFKPGQCISENFYFRKDGTRVYFFTQEELDDLLTSAGLIKELNHVDRRLIVNRGKQQKMYRIWLQCRYRKPLRPFEI